MTGARGPPCPKTGPLPEARAKCLSHLLLASVDTSSCASIGTARDLSGTARRGGAGTCDVVRAKYNRSRSNAGGGIAWYALKSLGARQTCGWSSRRPRARPPRSGVAPAVSEYVVRGAVVTDSSWKSWTSGVAALAAARRADNSTSAPDAATKPADAAAAHAIDAVRAVGDVSVQAIRRRRTDAVVEMNVLTNYCVAAFRDEPRVLPINSSS